MNDCIEDLERARTDLAQAERHVRLQQDILDHLRSIGGSTQVAEALLSGFKVALVEQHRQCRQIEAAAGEASHH